MGVILLLGYSFIGQFNVWYPSLKVYNITSSVDAV